MDTSIDPAELPSLPVQPPRLRMAARGSHLSLAQALQVVVMLHQHWPSLRVSTRVVDTHGDRDRVTALAEMVSPDGIFTRAVEAELLAGRADWAVHSLKDLPTALDPSLVLVAYPPRADPRDALVSRHPGGFDGLPPGARLGTSSPRRMVQALAYRPDLHITSVRGNVETRLRKLDGGELDGLILAVAGLERLGLADARVERLPTDRFTPAAGQGALAVQCRAADVETARLLAVLDDPPTRAAVSAERTFLRALGGGCRAPIAAHAEVQGDRLTLRGFVATPDGQHIWTDEVIGPADIPEAVGLALGRRVRAAVGSALLTEVLRG